MALDVPALLDLRRSPAMRAVSPRRWALRSEASSRRALSSAGRCALAAAGSSATTSECDGERAAAHDAVHAQPSTVFNRFCSSRARSTRRPSRMLREEVVDRLPRFGAGRGVAREVERQQVDALDQLVVVDLGRRLPGRRRRLARARRGRARAAASRRSSSGSRRPLPRSRRRGRRARDRAPPLARRRGARAARRRGSGPDRRPRRRRPRPGASALPARRWSS